MEMHTEQWNKCTDDRWTLISMILHFEWKIEKRHYKQEYIFLKGINLAGQVYKQTWVHTWRHKNARAEKSKFGWTFMKDSQNNVLHFKKDVKAKCDY